MEKKEFMALLKQGASAKREVAGTADWDRIIDEAAESGRSYSVSQFYDELVKGAVSKGRARNKLNDLFAKKKAARLVRDGAYIYCFDAEAIKIQHGE